jgi:nucleoside-diphosphate-sugar epimerase
MKVLVTGASGRFAEHVVRSLRGGYELVLASRQKPPEDRADLTWIQADLNVFEDCQRVVQGVDAIQHIAGVPWPSDRAATVARRKEQGLPEIPFDATIKTNVMGTYYLMTAAVQAGVKVVVMTGSNCAFGLGSISRDPKYLPIDELHPSGVEDSYSYSKLAGEGLLKMFTNAYGIRTYITRPAWIRNAADRKVHAETMKPATEWGGSLFGYIPSEDYAELHRLIMEKNAALPAHDIFCANAADTLALEPSLELVEKFRPELLPMTKIGDTYQAFFSCAKAHKLVGWTVKHSWRDDLPK